MLRHPDPINASGSASAQQMSGSGWLDEARNLAVNGEALIDPYDMEFVNEELLWCVLYSKSVCKSCLTHVSSDVKIGFETKECPRGHLSRILQAHEYHRTVKDVSLSRNNISHDLNNFADRVR
jgi:hypothetical protein